jgi:predicted patatin/cPLA2 family phospholipase
MSIAFRRLALGGGGMKGLLHIGVLQELSKNQELKFPDGVYGSSIGSIIATYVAFGLPIDNMVPLAKKYLNMEKIVPNPGFSHFIESISNKGFFSMDLFEKTVVEMFSEAGIDISDKKLNDAQMPLYILTSNISKRIPSVLSGNVSVISALKCSCCVPAVFKPQELYEQLYLDGDIYSPCISNIVPIDDTTLVVSLIKQNGKNINPKNIEKCSAIDYVETLYLSIMLQLYNAQSKPGILHLKYPGLYSTSKIEDLNIDSICAYSADSLRTFLTERGYEKSTESSNGGLS